MTTRASGTFDVEITPQAGRDDSGAPRLGRMWLDKRFHGDLDATSRGEMLTAGEIASGSAGYVAIERVSGALHGRRGAFALQHSGVMNRGVGELSITVVPGSGTEELAGLSGRMAVHIAGGDHSYDFDYALSDTE
jgi:uncharacterized protein DUF3224